MYRKVYRFDSDLRYLEAFSLAKGFFCLFCDANHFGYVYVYAIRSAERNYIYVGLSDNLERRVHQHNSGSNKTTKPYAPFVLIWSETFPTRIEARKREKYLKSGSEKEFLKSLRQRA